MTRSTGKIFRPSKGWINFYHKVEIVPDCCWIWLGALNADGYPQFTNPFTQKVTRAHRLSYELFVADIPASTVLDHLCRNRWCVNPSHLEPVSVTENILRGISWAAINAQKTHCKRGHLLPVARNHSGARECRDCRLIRGRYYYYHRKHNRQLALQKDGDA